MKKKKLPKSLRKYIRKEKARIRREVLDIKEQERLIKELYQRIFEKLKERKTIQIKPSLSIYYQQNYENRIKRTQND